MVTSSPRKPTTAKPTAAPKAAAPAAKAAAKPAAKSASKPAGTPANKTALKAATAASASKRKAPKAAPPTKPMAKANGKASTPSHAKLRTPSAPAVTADQTAAMAKKHPGALKPLAEAKEKTKKAKLVRDSFTMPELEYAALGEVKRACLKTGFEVKKSELLRVGVAMIRKMDLAALQAAVGALSPLKPGRPRKEK